MANCANCRSLCAVGTDAARRGLRQTTGYSLRQVFIEQVSGFALSHPRGAIHSPDWPSACGNCGNCGIPRNHPRPTLLKRPRRGLGHLLAPLLREVAAVSDLQRRRAVAYVGMKDPVLGPSVMRALHADI